MFCAYGNCIANLKYLWGLMFSSTNIQACGQKIQFCLLREKKRMTDLMLHVIIIIK